MFYFYLEIFLQVEEEPSCPKCGLEVGEMCQPLLRSQTSLVNMTFSSQTSTRRLDVLHLLLRFVTS